MPRTCTKEFAVTIEGPSCPEPAVSSYSIPANLGKRGTPLESGFHDLAYMDSNDRLWARADTLTNIYDLWDYSIAVPAVTSSTNGGFAASAKAVYATIYHPTADVLVGLIRRKILPADPYTWIYYIYDGGAESLLATTLTTGYARALIMRGKTDQVAFACSFTANRIEIVDVATKAVLSTYNFGVDLKVNAGFGYCCQTEQFILGEPKTALRLIDATSGTIDSSFTVNGELFVYCDSTQEIWALNNTQTALLVYNLAGTLLATLALPSGLWDSDRSVMHYDYKLDAVVLAGPDGGTLEGVMYVYKARTRTLIQTVTDSTGDFENNAYAICSSEASGDIYLRGRRLSDMIYPIWQTQPT